MNGRIENVEGSYGYEKDGAYAIGVSSGASRIGLGVSNQMAVITAVLEGRPTPRFRDMGLSLTPDQAEQLGRELIEHAEKVRARA